MLKRIAELEVKRVRLHDYCIMKLEERDYHAVADAAMDLRELEVESKLLKDQHQVEMRMTNMIKAGELG